MRSRNFESVISTILFLWGVVYHFPQPSLVYAASLIFSWPAADSSLQVELFIYGSKYSEGDHIWGNDWAVGWVSLENVPLESSEENQGIL
ncbi:hypothetical protein L3X38_020472 [Prunus dulcis]|uniref:Uncharacterized protein n=1 Tax=Prunus dulcis TaxID=3755 RepID=A0AAD4ZDI7_PRUDU|nr:hypothetical protein L3X38_020472 [Prunus dulcis]